MIHDKGPRFILGFGIQPSRVPFQAEPNTQEGPPPNSSFIAKALYKHPIAKFLTTATASMVGMAVASKVVHSGGVKLFEQFGVHDLPHLSRDAQINLLHGYRKTQSIFDEWEGVSRLRDPNNPDRLIKRSSFFLTRAARERSAESAAQGGFTEKVEDWTLRDSIQQRLVHEARALPYQLPALYVANRFANTLVGNQNTQVNWSNPVDVIGDFAQQSLKNTMTMLAPFAVGSAGLKHGWQKLMTQGDFAASTSTFAPHIRQSSLALQTILQQFGQDASSILYQTTRLGQQAAGSFSSAIDEATKSKKPIGFQGITWNRNLFKTRLKDNPHTLFGFKRFKIIQDAQAHAGVKGSLAEVLPTVSGFGRGWRRQWRTLEDEYLNREAARRGDNTYFYGGEDRAVDLQRIHATSDVASIVDIMNPEGQMRTFESMRKNVEYRKLLEAELSKRIAAGSQGNLKILNLRSRQMEATTPEAIARRFVRFADITGPRIKSSAQYSRRQEVMDRVKFGTKTIHDSLVAGESDWETQFQERIQAIVPGHEGRISHYLPHAMASADRRFLNEAYSLDLTKRIGKEWQDIRERVIVPYAKSRLGEAPLAYEDFGHGLSQKHNELLIRKTAETLGLPLRENGRILSTADLKNRVTQLGIHTSNPHEMRAILVDSGAIAKPWTKGGFNLLGMRPLTIQTAMSHNYFGSDQRKDINRLFEEMAQLDHPFVRDLVNRKVGRNVWETRSGRIVDLNPVVAAGHRLGQVAGRQTQVPFLHFNPFDILGLNSRSRIARKPIIQILPTRSQHFGSLRGDLPETNFDSYIWMRHRGTKGRIAGHRLGGDIQFARGYYHSMPTMGDSKEARNTRIAWGNKGTYVPRNLSQPESNREKWRRRFALDPEQPDSIFGLGRRFIEGEFGERHLTPLGRRLEARGGRLGRLGKAMQFQPDIRNPAVLARIIRTRGVFNFADEGGLGTGRTRVASTQLRRNRLENIWGEAYSNFEKELRRFPITRAIASGIEDINPELGAKLRILHPTQGSKSLADIHDPREMRRAIQHTFTADLNRAEEDDTMRANIRSAQGFINKVFLREDPANLSLPASRAKGTTGINTRLDELRADAYRYLVAREAIFSGDSGQVVQNLLSSVDDLSLRGHISGAQRNEARAAILSMQTNILSLAVRRNEGSTLENIHDTLANLLHSPGAQVLPDIEHYDQQLLNADKFWGLERVIRRHWRMHTGVRPESFHGVRYNPFSSGQSDVFMPSFGTTMGEHPWRSVKSNILGLTTYSDREVVSPAGIAVSHFHQRLNRYFQMMGLGVNETAFKGPTGMLNWGLVGRRVFPAVAGGAILLGIDRELGGLVHGKDQYGHRRYTPLVSGFAATRLAHLDVGIHYLAGPGAADRKRQELFGDQDVPIRRGRWWPLGNQPWRGGRIMYYRPSWYRRFMSGYQYTDQSYGSPAERLAFDYDFSPLHWVPGLNYHYERKHYKDRPYPVTGDMFTGPWGPLTTELNATLGRVLKPHLHMHKQEFAQAMSEYERFGQYGMTAPQMNNPYPRVVTRGTSGGVQIVSPTRAGGFLAEPTPSGSYAPMGANDGYTRPYNQPYGFIGQPYGTSPETALDSYGQGGYSGRGGLSGKGGAPVEFAPGDADSLSTTNGPAYFGKNKYSPYNRVYMARGFSFDPRVIPATNPLNPGKGYYQSGQWAYEAQEMAGIYGWGIGGVREALGMGSSTHTPNAPVLQQASRGYGSERGFWDLNLGGLGDFPTPFQGEYGNIEFSEIARRFIPHRRRDINELNPIPNQMGQQYPWLPSNDYFTDFTRGDPYVSTFEGELRLPGAGYERVHQLHSDQTGRYGLLDQHRILGSVAPWSEEYRAIDSVLRRMPLSDDQKVYAQTTRKQVAQVKKRHEFFPYKYAHSDFRRQDVSVVGFAPGDADKLITSMGPVQLAGLRARRTPDAMAAAQQLIHAGDHISIMYDANNPLRRDQPLEAMIWTQSGHNFGQALMDQGLAFEGRKNNALENRAREGPIAYKMHTLFERAAHLNTLINQKFYPHRSAVEQWERYNIYGSDFPQWNHPYRDYIEPLGYRAMNRNPFVAASVLAVVGGAFGTTPQAKTAGRLFGGFLGAGLAMESNAKSFETGSRYIPPKREEQFAVEENTDILNYLKYARMYAFERQEAIDQENSDPETYARRIENSKYKQYQFTNLGPHTLSALDARKKMKQTLYGADLYGSVMDLKAAMPKRKRDFFMEFLNAPVNERARILSTAPRLERRLYEARWGLRVEQRPDLVDYFSEHELPNPNWEGWNNRYSMDDVQMKVLQSQGLDASQMGYFPQQIQEANLTNPSYPNFSAEQSHQQSAAQLRNLMTSLGIKGDVSIRRTNSPGSTINLQMGTS